MSARLNRLLTLEEEVRAADGAGGFTTQWTTKGTLWAEVRPGTGREQGADFLTYATVPYRITVRAAPHGAPSCPVAGQRLREGARIFRVLAVADTEAGLFLTCFCHEEVPR